MKKRYWLRGGVVGAVLALCVVFLFGSSFFDSLIPDMYNAKVDNIFLVLFFLTPIILWGKSYMWMYLIGPILWFIPGSIIGWIYGKIKNRNKSNIMV